MVTDSARAAGDEHIHARHSNACCCSANVLSTRRQRATPGLVERVQTEGFCVSDRAGCYGRS